MNTVGKDNKNKKKVILIGLDGMPADFIDRFKDKLPELNNLLNEGFFSPAHSSPTTETPTNWTTIATGAWQGTHGITSFHAHLKGMKVNETIHTFNSHLCQAEYIWQAAERQGKKFILINYPTAFPITIEKGIAIGGDGLASEKWSPRWPDFMTSKTMKINKNNETDNEVDISVFGEVKTEVSIKMKNAENWLNIPANYKVIREGYIEFEESEHFNWGALGIIIDKSSQKKEVLNIEKRHILVFEEDGKKKILFSKEKDVKRAICVLEKGQWSGWILEEFFGVKCIRQYKLIDLSDDGRIITIYGTMGGSLNGWGYPAGIEEEIIKNCGAYIEALELTPDQALHHQWFGSDTCLEIMQIQADWMVKASEYLSKNNDWDVMFIQYHAPDGMNHMLLGGYWNDDPRIVEETDSFMLSVYETLFKMVNKIKEKCADENTYLLVVSDHGTLPVKYYINAHSILIREGWEVFEKNDKGLWSLDISKSKANFAHWNNGLWINVKGREQGGIVNPGKEYEELRSKIINRFRKVVGENEEPAFDIIARRESCENLGLWGERIPDIMAFSRSNYLFMGGKSENVDDNLMALYKDPRDIIPAAEAFKAGVVRPIYSMHSNLPCAREEGLTSMRAIFLLVGPDIRKNSRGNRVNLVDVTPTISYISGFNPPDTCEGRIVREAFKK